MPVQHLDRRCYRIGVPLPVALLNRNAADQTLFNFMAIAWFFIDEFGGVKNRMDHHAACCRFGQVIVQTFFDLRRLCLGRRIPERLLGQQDALGQPFQSSHRVATSIDVGLSADRHGSSSFASDLENSDSVAVQDSASLIGDFAGRFTRVQRLMQHVCELVQMSR